MTWQERFEETGLKKPQKDLACSKELLSWKDAFLVGANMVSSASGAQNLLSSAGICSSLRAENHFVTLVRKHAFWGENLVANSESSQIESHFQKKLELDEAKGSASQGWQKSKTRLRTLLSLAKAARFRWVRTSSPPRKRESRLRDGNPGALHLPLACVCGPWLEL